MLRAAVVAAIFASRSATAAPPRIEIAGAACDATVMRAELADVLHPEAAVPFDGARVRVTTSADAGELRAELTFEDRDGRVRGPRVVRATDCTDLASSVAVVVAMALEDLASVPVPPVEVDAELDRQPSPPRQWTVELVGGYATIGDGRGELVLGGRTMRGRGSLAVELHIDETDEAHMTDGRGVDVDRFELVASPCLHGAGFGACALASAGVARGSATPGLYQTRTVYGAVLAGGLRATYEGWLRDRIGLRLHVDGRAIATSMTLEVDYQPVWKSKRFEGAAGIDVLVRFR